MRVLSDGVPMTNGEVYALLRRRRDERSAAAHLPFNLQRVQADPQSRTSNTMIQYRSSPHPNAAAAAAAAATTASAGGLNGGDESPRLANATAAAGAAFATLPPTAADVVATNDLLASSSAGHLAVLLTEVHVLGYLVQPPVSVASANHASIPESFETARIDGGDGARQGVESSPPPPRQQEQQRMRELYGPSTVYDMDVGGLTRTTQGASTGADVKQGREASGGEQEEKHTGNGGGDGNAPAASAAEGRSRAQATCADVKPLKQGSEDRKGKDSRGASEHVHNDDGKNNDDDNDAIAVECVAAEQAMQHAIAFTHAGSVSHVRSVGCALAYYEARGRQQERNWARGIMNVLAQMRTRGYWPPLQSSSPLGAAVTGSHRLPAGHSETENEEQPTRSSWGSALSTAATAAGASVASGGGRASRTASSRPGSDSTSVKKEVSIANAVMKEMGTAADSEAGTVHTRFLPSSAVAGGRPLLRQPQDLVAMAGEGLMGVVSPASSHNGVRSAQDATMTAATTGRAALLSDAEVMQLVVGRPATSLQVHRLVDDLGGRLGHTDEAVAFFVKNIIDVFRKK